MRISLGFEGDVAIIDETCAGEAQEESGDFPAILLLNPQSQFRPARAEAHPSARFVRAARGYDLASIVVY
jgi:hypothetical protein